MLCVQYIFFIQTTNTAHTFHPSSASLTMVLGLYRESAGIQFSSKAGRPAMWIHIYVIYARGHTSFSNAFGHAEPLAHRSGEWCAISFSFVALLWQEERKTQFERGRRCKKGNSWGQICEFTKNHADLFSDDRLFFAPGYLTGSHCSGRKSLFGCKYFVHRSSPSDRSFVTVLAHQSQRASITSRRKKLFPTYIFHRYTFFRHFRIPHYFGMNFSVPNVETWGKKTFLPKWIFDQSFLNQQTVPRPHF